MNIPNTIHFTSAKNFRLSCWWPLGSGSLELYTFGRCVFDPIMVTVWNHKQICNHSFNTFVNYQRILLLIDFAVDWDRSMERNWNKNPRCKLLMRRPCLTSVTHSGQQAIVYIVHNKIGQRGESTTRVHSSILTYRKSRILDKRTSTRINDKEKTTNCNLSC